MAVGVNGHGKVQEVDGLLERGEDPVEAAALLHILLEFFPG